MPKKLKIKYEPIKFARSCAIYYEWFIDKPLYRELVINYRLIVNNKSYEWEIYLELEQLEKIENSKTINGFLFEYLLRLWNNLQPRLELWRTIDFLIWRKISREISQEISQDIVEIILPYARQLQLRDSSKKSKDPENHAVNLPIFASRLDEPAQANLIELRVFWYGDRPLNLWTHYYVRIQTYKHLIYDHFWFWLWDKITSLFQTMERDRILRVKDSE